MDTAPSCLRCSTPMLLGFLRDTMQGPGSLYPEWVSGTPKKSFWKGVDISGEERRQVVTFRCPKCGCLESYAGDLIE